MKYEKVKEILEGNKFLLLREGESRRGESFSFWLSSSGKMMRLTDQGEMRTRTAGIVRYEVEQCEVKCMTF